MDQSLVLNSVTVTVLPVSLSLVHIPRYRLKHLTHPIIEQILRPSPTFLNISCNPTEVSIIAEESYIKAFVKIARRDEKHVRRAVQEGRPAVDPVVVSSSWSALQIDSHGDQLDDAGARIREISSLLSGISILYQSSHDADFIFVLSSKLPQVVSILGAAGFFAFSTDPSDLSSQMSSLACSSTESVNSYGSDEEGTQSSRGPWNPLKKSSRSSSTMFPMILEHYIPQLDGIRPRSATNNSLTSLQSLLLTKTNSPSESYLPSPMPLPDMSASFTTASSAPTTRDQASPPVLGAERSKTPIPVVEVVPPDIVVVGLSEQYDHVEAWTMKIIKLLLFPDTLPSRNSMSPASDEEDDEPLPGRRTSSLGLGLSTVRSSSPSSDEMSSIEESEDEESESTTSSSTGSFSSRPSVMTTSTPSLTSSRYQSQRFTTGATSLAEDRSLSKDSKFSVSSAQIRPRSKATPSPPVLSDSRTSASLKRVSSSGHHRSTSSLAYFSLTRTADAASLATDVRLLATLFPPEDRYLVFCADEFEHLSRVEEEERKLERRGRDRSSAWPLLHQDHDRNTGFMKCLHIDLAAFGLEKNGFINRFSDVLHSHSINHLYSSTFKTANLLVDETDVARAQALLREC